jgi:hypothetical protein
MKLCKYPITPAIHRKIQLLYLSGTGGGQVRELAGKIKYPNL